ncbi:peptidase inhibitor family I36 protein [Streptomyces sp. H27-S2]|uniref:peptidase inhibitor family I36 protein n=1 Tax=Streptomyces antarcticus TaxID=2996458 RepID=UPI002270BEE9|nr:peptidase inhibitor family I36 protein [Streptomyces sp. H27-S2]MCY0948691.1 peptidase inhibitor family I36 protein [Streptomyces sp. H27-S2]
MRTCNTPRGTTVLAAAVLAFTALVPSTAPTAHAATAQAAPTHSLPGRPVAGPAPAALGTCAAGQLCLWAKPEFKGVRYVHELSTLDINSCTALPAGKSAQALANRTGRPVTTYQSAECAETGEFQTYPGDGVWLPQSPYQVRAFKVWEH